MEVGSALNQTDHQEEQSMNSIGKTIQCLRKAKGVTQEKMEQQIGVSFQAISKWENESTMPDIMMLPALADYFGVSIDELFQYKWNALTSKERLISFMLKNDILCVQNEEPGRPFEYFINTERFTTNMQISAIGEAFAETLMDSHVEYNAVAGIAYHGIGFAAATAFALQNRYGVTRHFFYDRLKPDSRGRWICGYTPVDGDRVVVVNDVLNNGRDADEHIERMLKDADIKIAAILVLAERAADSRGRRRLEEKYHTKVYGMITDEDVRSVLKRGIVKL